MYRAAHRMQNMSLLTRGEWILTVFLFCFICHATQCSVDTQHVQFSESPTCNATFMTFHNWLQKTGKTSCDWQFGFPHSPVLEHYHSPLSQAPSFSHNFNSCHHAPWGHKFIYISTIN